MFILKNERNFDLIISELICTYAHGRFLDGSDNTRLTDYTCEISTVIADIKNL